MRTMRNLLLAVIAVFSLSALSIAIPSLAAASTPSAWYLHWNCGGQSQCRMDFGAYVGIRQGLGTLSEKACNADLAYWASHNIMQGYVKKSGDLQGVGAWCDQSDSVRETGPKLIGSTTKIAHKVNCTRGNQLKTFANKCPIGWKKKVTSTQTASHTDVVFQNSYSGSLGTVTNIVGCGFSTAISGSISFSLAKDVVGNVAGTGRVTTTLDTSVTHAPFNTTCSGGSYSTTSTGAVTGTTAHLAGTFTDGATHPFTLVFSGQWDGNTVLGSAQVSQTMKSTSTSGDQYLPMSSSLSCIALSSSTGIPTTGCPSQPSGLIVTTVVSIAGTDMTLSWNNSGDNASVAGYSIYLNGTQVSTVTGTSYDFGVLPCTSNFPQTLGVAANNSAGYPSGTASVQAKSFCTALTR
jgi:hypothetical protein